MSIIDSVTDKICQVRKVPTYVNNIIFDINSLYFFFYNSIIWIENHTAFYETMILIQRTHTI